MENKVISPFTLFSGFVKTEESSSIMDLQDNDSTKWTNEKHSLYLKSIEASFVDQLYNSLDMPSCKTQNASCSDAVSTWKNHPGQYKVLRHGNWSIKSFRQDDSPPSNNWVRHFKNESRKRQSSTATSLQYPVPESELKQEPGCSNNLYQHAIDAEVTDQNFVENTSCRKRVRTSKIGHASNDQVVPTREIPDGYVSPKKEGSSLKSVSHNRYWK